MAQLSMSLDDIIKTGKQAQPQDAPKRQAAANDEGANSKVPKQFFKKPAPAPAPAPVATQHAGGFATGMDMLTTSMLLTAQQIANTMAMMGNRQPTLEAAIQQFVVQGGAAGPNATELSRLISTLASSALASSGAAGAEAAAPARPVAAGGGAKAPRVHAKQSAASHSTTASAQLMQQHTDIAVAGNKERRAALLAKGRLSAASAPEHAPGADAPQARKRPKVIGKTSMLLKDRFDRVHGVKP
eukprot:TRINITY_DN13500_c0_g1_i1.p1 TRINITY_DN13500_c0_g1~~TRINITY_DN13500_c0_g1_i1.p1  ORF type:complete len:243 (+),score=54.92 TRINITY_DN13500_c0_g1_i1:115-843(+)